MAQPRRAPAILRRPHLRDGGLPAFFPLVPFQEPPPAANPVIPFIRGQWLGDSRPDHRGAKSFFFPVVPWQEPPANPVILFTRGQWISAEPPNHKGAKSFYFPLVSFIEPPIPPVIQFTMGQWIGDRVTPYPGTMARHFPFPYFQEPPPAPANPVIPYVQSAWQHWEADAKTLGIKSPPRYSPLVIFQEEWYTYEAPILRLDVSQFTGMSFYLEAILQSDTGAEVKLRLFNITDGVEAGSVTTTSTTPVRVRSGALSLAGIKEYRAEIRRTYNVSTIVKAARIVTET